MLDTVNDVRDEGGAPMPTSGPRGRRFTRRTAKIATATAVALSLALTGCAGGGASGAGSEALTIVQSAQPWSSLDPAAPVVTGMKGFLYQVYDSLLRLNAEGELEPWLATSYEVSEDGLTWTFELEEGVTFTDGTPFDAEAVKFNLERQIDPDQHAGEGSNLPADMTISTDGDSTVLLHLTSPNAAIPWALAGTSVGLIASPTAIEKYGDEYGLHPVGTGPFKLDKQVVGQSATLVKNEDYWVDGQPKLETVNIKFIPSSQTALQTLQSGGAQMMDFVQPLQAQNAESDANLELIVSKATGVDQMWLNTRKPPFDDVRARQAVAYAMDTASLSEDLFYGYYQPGQSPIASGSWAFPGAEVAGYPAYDLDEAKRLVQELGGLTFTYTIANNTSSQEVAAAIQSQLAEAGIDMILKPQEETALIADEFSGNYEAANARVPGTPDPDSYVGQFFSSAMGPTGIDDPALFDLFAQGRAESDPEKRAAIYKQVAERMAELTPTIVIAENPPTRLINKQLKGLIAPPFAGFYLNDASLG